MIPSLGNVRNQNVNQKWAGKPCAKCNIALALRDQVSTCEVCGTPHHQQCWIGNNGCAGDRSCVNAPPPVEALEARPEKSSLAVSRATTALSRTHDLREMDPLDGPPERKEAPLPGETICPSCGNTEDYKANFCRSCRTVFDSTSMRRAPGALASVVWSTVGLALLGFIGPIFAIRQSANARELIEMDPTYTGMGMARTGQILGWTGLVLSVIGLIGLFLR